MEEGVLLLLEDCEGSGEGVAEGEKVGVTVGLVVLLKVGDGEGEGLGEAVGVGEAEGHVTLRSNAFAFSVTISTFEGVRHSPTGFRNVAAPIAAPFAAPCTAVYPARVVTVAESPLNATRLIPPAHGPVATAALPESAT